MNLEKTVVHGKHGKTRKNSNACLGESCHLMGDLPISFNPVFYSVIFVFSVDEKRF
jgi:hypothetical protein